MERCFSSEEFEHTPTVRKTKKVPLGKFTRQVDQWFRELISAAVELPEPHGSRIYPCVQNAYVGWLTYSAAVKEKSDHVIQEIWKIKRGPRGQGLHELQKEFALLKTQRQSLTKQLKSKTRGKPEPKFSRQLRALDAELSRIRKKVEKDYGIVLD